MPIKINKKFLIEVNHYFMLYPLQLHHQSKYSVYTKGLMNFLPNYYGPATHSLSELIRYSWDFFHSDSDNLNKKDYTILSRFLTNLLYLTCLDLKNQSKAALLFCFDGINKYSAYLEGRSIDEPLDFILNKLFQEKISASSALFIFTTLYYLHKIEALKQDHTQWFLTLIENIAEDPNAQIKTIYHVLRYLNLAVKDNYFQEAACHHEAIQKIFLRLDDVSQKNLAWNQTELVLLPRPAKFQILRAAKIERAPIMPCELKPSQKENLPPTMKLQKQENVQKKGPQLQEEASLQKETSTLFDLTQLHYFFKPVQPTLDPFLQLLQQEQREKLRQGSAFLNA